jgi:hypothetical protein
MLEVKDLGDAEEILHTDRHIDETARDFLQRGIIPTEDGWGGWLGRYQAALAEASVAITRGREVDLGRNHGRKRQRDRSFGR